MKTLIITFSFRSYDIVFGYNVIQTSCFFFLGRINRLLWAKQPTMLIESPSGRSRPSDKGRGAGRSSRPGDKRWGESQKKIFRPFGPHFGQKVRGRAPPGPSSGFATDPWSWLCEIPGGGGYDKILRNVGLKQKFPPLVWGWGNGYFLAWLHNCVKVLLDTVRMPRS